MCFNSDKLQLKQKRRRKHFVEIEKSNNIQLYWKE